MSVTLTLTEKNDAELARTLSIYAEIFARKVGANPAIAAPYEPEAAVVTTPPKAARTSSKKATAKKANDDGVSEVVVGDAPAETTTGAKPIKKEAVVKAVQKLIKAKGGSGMKEARKILLRYKDKDGDVASTVASLLEADYASFIKDCSDSAA